MPIFSDSKSKSIPPPISIVSILFLNPFLVLIALTSEAKSVIT